MCPAEVRGLSLLLQILRLLVAIFFLAQVYNFLKYFKAYFHWWLQVVSHLIPAQTDISKNVSAWLAVMCLFVAVLALLSHPLGRHGGLDSEHTNMLTRHLSMGDSEVEGRYQEAQGKESGELQGNQPNLTLWQNDGAYPCGSSFQTRGTRR